MRNLNQTPSTATPDINALHPGNYVRSKVLTPKKLTVSAAAKLLGVGRPAFSNFLNGHAAASPEMATRIEVTFGLPAQKLLELQTAYETAQAKKNGAINSAIPYVVPFLGIKATEIEGWVDRNIQARSRLAVLIRTLVNSTCNTLAQISFPGNEDAERPGWDGFTEATQPTQWVPEGLCGWEFGTNSDIKTKADKDFAKSIKATSKDERQNTTFIFVTPRHWNGKKGWIEANTKKSEWKDVRAYDSDDLEQWIEQSIAAQIWFANETEHASKNVRSLDKCWRDWAHATTPPLSESLFTSAIEIAKKSLASFLSSTPTDAMVIAADSTDEALAFLAQALGPNGGNELEQYRDRVLVFNEPGVLSKLAQGTKNFIAVTANRDVERELGQLVPGIQAIVIYPRNAANVEPNIELEPLHQSAFRSALEKMGYASDEITRLSNESGRSLTVLRRRLATIPAVCTPTWANDPITAEMLVPFLFVGTWNSANTTDQTTLALLADSKYEELEKRCQRLTTLNDAPLWSVGTFRGVVSKIDLLFAIANAITTPMLERYFGIAEMVLGEDDPRLDLPEDKRWLASIYGKTRTFSAPLRKGICETLVLLSIHGDGLFERRLGFNCRTQVTLLIRKLLTPLKTRILEAQDNDLVMYSEAAPNEFLSILENDLLSDSPATYGLMRPADSGIFGGGCPRTGLLWALEVLAWNPETLPRVALILAQLSEIEISDNWGNKPIASLMSIFRAWMPQTAADHQTRVEVLKLITARFPKVGWKVCVNQISIMQQVGSYSHKPLWRNDGRGFGEPFTKREPIDAFRNVAIDLLLEWKGEYTREMLCDLIERLPALSEEHKTEVWKRIETWSSGTVTDTDKAFVREKIRVTALSRRSLRRSAKHDSSQLSKAARLSYQSLEPSTALHKHEWLFRTQWVDESADEPLDDDMDYAKREERIERLRTDALREILTSESFSGIFKLAEMGTTAGIIGWLLAKNILPKQEIHDFLRTVLSSVPTAQSRVTDELIRGALASIEDAEERTSIVLKARAGLSNDDFVRLLLVAPFRRSTWHVVDTLDDQYQHKYWDEVAPYSFASTDDETNESVDRLLRAQRPRAAFSSVNFKLESVAPELLYRLMTEMAKGGKDKPGQYQLDQHYIAEAFERLDKNPALSIDQKATLEFAYIDALSQPWRGRGSGKIPNLERYIEKHPEAFVQSIVWTYKRNGGGNDPPEWQVPIEKRKNLAERGYKLLDGLSRIPGSDDNFEDQADNLLSWVRTVRERCAQLDRLEIADICIGKLLSQAPVGADGAWPCEPVRQVMEDVHSQKIMSGAHTGLFNSRGVVTRGNGGEQERQLAEKYRTWANALRYSHPYVSSELLLEMVKTYEYDASREDTESEIRKRLH